MASSPVQVVKCSLSIRISFGDWLQDVSRQERLFPGGIFQVFTLLVFIVMRNWKQQVKYLCYVEC